jgi:hypothetical protein
VTPEEDARQVPDADVDVELFDHGFELPRSNSQRRRPPSSGG